MMSRQQICRTLCIPVVLLLASINSATQAQSVVLDQTLGNGASLGAGPTYSITEATGRTIGKNLFHSFSRFWLLGGETAEFTTAGAIQNIPRVTGGDVSTIDGTIRSPANLFFLNPNGVVFNSGATLDVNGSFHASTADYLRMGATAFYADESRASPNLPSLFAIDPAVLIDTPEAFGFVSENPASITVNGSTLRVAEGARVALVGGDTTLTGGGLTARSGTIHLASVSSTGEAILTEQGLDTASFSELGELAMRAGAKLDASESFLAPDGAGQIVIRAGSFELDSARLLADTEIGSGGDIDIGVSGRFSLANGSRVRSLTDADGDAASIRVRAGNIEIRGGSRIASSTAGAGRASDITVDASGSIVASNLDADPRFGPFANGIASDVTLGAAGGGGDITISTPTLTMERSVISADTIGFGLDFQTRGRPGNIRIRTNKLEMSDQALIQNASRSFDPDLLDSQTAREIRVHPLDPLLDSTIRLTGQGTDIRGNALLSTQGGSSISLEATEVRLSEGALLSTSVIGGRASAGRIDIVTDRLSLAGSSGIQSDAQLDFFQVLDGNLIGIPTGSSGDISIRANESIVLETGSSFFRTRISSTTFGVGDGGRISLTATNADGTGTVLVDGAAIETNNLSPFEGVRAGDVRIDADVVRVAAGGLVESVAGVGSSGPAGNVTIGATSSLTVRGANVDLQSSAVSTSTIGDGPGGEMRLSAGRIVVEDGASVDSLTNGPGSGGRIRIGRGEGVSFDTDELVIQNGGKIVAASLAEGESAGAAGSIEIDVERLVLSSGGRVNASTIDGDGGTVTIRASDRATFSGSDSRSSSGVFTDTRGAGPAGSLTIDTPRLEMSDRAQVLASAGAGSSATAGDINLRVGEMDLSGRALVSAESIGTGSAGVIDIGGRGEAGQPAQSLVSRDGRITTESLQAGGGSIALDANLVLLSEDSLITTNVASGTESGNVRINARFLDLDNSNVTADGGEGAGGNIAIVVDPTNDTGNSQFPPGFLVLKDTSEVRADGGNQGGKINISAAGFTASQTSLVQARARQPAGVDGEVGIQALIAGVSESITPLPGNFLDAAALLRARCAERASGGETSSFIAAGRDGLPPEPGGLLSSSVFDLVPAPAASSNRSASALRPIKRLSSPWFWYTPIDQRCPQLTRVQAQGARQ